MSTTPVNAATIPRSVYAPSLQSGRIHCQPTLAKTTNRQRAAGEHAAAGDLYKVETMSSVDPQFSPVQASRPRCASRAVSYDREVASHNWNLSNLFTYACGLR